MFFYTGVATLRPLFGGGYDPAPTYPRPWTDFFGNFCGLLLFENGNATGKRWHKKRWRHNKRVAHPHPHKKCRGKHGTQLDHKSLPRGEWIPCGPWLQNPSPPCPLIGGGGGGSNTANIPKTWPGQKAPQAKSSTSIHTRNVRNKRHV